MNQKKLATIQKKWNARWKRDGIYRVHDTVSKKKKMYHMTMFPYPSGNLHIGHWYNFAPADVRARMERMKGYTVLAPIGFDAFGLPAENAAIKRGIHPKTWTYANIRTMTKQLESIGAIYDWDRMIVTADPEYYRWTQWIFLQLFQQGLAYKTEAPANWCPSCHTVLANEQVVQGACDRCGTEVIQKNIEQWRLKITAYAERLLHDLDALDWPEKTKVMQRNWIGKSEGSSVSFPIVVSNSQHTKPTTSIEVFTTRIDTIYGCTYMVIAPEHPILTSYRDVITNYDDVATYIQETKKKSDLQRTDLAKEKTGILIQGICAINPATQKEIPIYSADYVLASYGTGAIMAVPAHDERDYEFAKKFNLPIQPVIYSETHETVYTGEGSLIHSGTMNGVHSSKARTILQEKLHAKKQTQYRLRDWLVSRQRYWGAPIPLVFCEHCAQQIKNTPTKSKQYSKGEVLNPGWIAVEETELPVKLPLVKNYLPTEEGKSPLAHASSFVHTSCPKCGHRARRETDTMDTFMCSSWYFFRYIDPHNQANFADYKKLKQWLPVDMYIGGAEHSVMHLLYARFITKVLYDIKKSPIQEPFAALRHQGMILGPDGQKMSKSRGNVIDPDALVKEFGADAVRMYLCFMGQYDQGGPWQPGGILGITRFLERIEKLYYQKKFSNNKNQISLSEDFRTLYHQTLKKVEEDIQQLNFNTAISTLMVCFRAFEQESEIPQEYAEGFLTILAPFAPYISQELWTECLQKKSYISETSWPRWNTKYIQTKIVSVVCQINGKKRAVLHVAAGADKETVLHTIQNTLECKKYIEGKTISKIVFVPDKIINIIIPSD